MLKADIKAEVVRMADFLGLELGDDKLQMVLQETDIETMKSKNDNIAHVLIRKGLTKDWENAPIPNEKWAEMDQVFSETLKDRPIAQPMLPYL